MQNTNRMQQKAEHLKNFSEWRNERVKAILEKGNPKTLGEFYLFSSKPKFRQEI